MQKRIGAFDAKTHFSNILDRVEHGEVIIITRHGREVAVIKAVQEENHYENRHERAIAAIRQLRIGVKLGDDIHIKDLVEEGRR